MWLEIKFRETNLKSFSPSCCEPKAAFDWAWDSPWSQWICISFTWFNQLSWSSKVELIVNSIIGLLIGLIVQGKIVWNLQAETWIFMQVKTTVQSNSTMSSTILTNCFSSSARALSIWSNSFVHLAWWISAKETTELSSWELFETNGSFSSLDGNSLDIRNGNSVEITARTLFLLRRRAAWRHTSC